MSEQRYSAELVRLRNAQLRLAIEEHRKNIMALGLGGEQMESLVDNKELVRVRKPFRCLLGRHRWVRMDTTWIMHRCIECRKERVWLP